MEDNEKERDKSRIKGNRTNIVPLETRDFQQSTDLTGSDPWKVE